MEIREHVKQYLQAFIGQPLRESAISLLATLGYHSEKTLDLGGSPEAFLDQFDKNSDRAFHKNKALFDDWNEIHLLFQLTDQELSGQSGLFGANEVSQGLMSSYLFFAVRLTGESYARGKLAQITRQLNRLFPMPVMVLFEYNEKLSIAVINRRRHKRDADKDVLGKVTFIQDISLVSPHRGHLDILGSFSLSALAGRAGIHSFDDLHAAWEEIFNVELLNKKFYRELSNWYFWAMQNVHFPFDDAEADKASLFSSDEKVREHDAKNLIRLLTRLLFVWFIKEKELIPEALFDSGQLRENLLKHFDPDSRHTRFYKAILQNLFFATLNQEVGKRAFRRSGQNMNVTNLLRYESYFMNPDEFIELTEKQTPFMNGGLFECLDKPHPIQKGSQGGEVIIYEDGFSDRGDNTLKVPDFLFFGKEKTIDLSDVYGDKKRRREKVRGIIPILNNYKFTIVENTPIEQEVALDPELLGKVFENLLASYNPETKTTARKQTGSFYTPRTIVDYMVDESLKAYLNKALCEACPEVTEGDAKEGLDILFAYTEKDHAFTDAEKHALIVAIDNCKILDPACGSGAFPMGVLHKLEFILGKLDPNNEMWRDRQVGKVDDTITAAEQIDDTTFREHAVRDLEAQKQDIEEAFSNNDLGYGRKLYLIENCIYGVDIQSIATQVSKLRFFISLIVEQGSDPEKDNFGIRPLPNLETKFITADTLIQIKKPTAQGELFESKKVQDLEKELKQVRHSLFNAKTPRTKRKYRLRDKELREQISIELENIGWSTSTAQQLSQWDPYDQNASSPFFDSEWMYGISDGFDIVIGNPPYQSAIEHKKTKGAVYRELIKSQYMVASGTWDLYIPFFEAALNLTQDYGVTSLITPNKYLSATYAKALRSKLPELCRIDRLTDVSHLPVFESASVYPVITQLSKAPTSAEYGIQLYLPKSRRSQFSYDEYMDMVQPSSNLTFLPENLWGFLLSPNLPILHEMLSDSVDLDSIATVRATTTAAEADAFGSKLDSTPTIGWRTLNTGTIDPFMNFWDSKPLRHQGRMYAEPIIPKGLQNISSGRRQLYNSPKIIIAKMALRFEGFVDDLGTYAALNCNCISFPSDGWTLYALASILHSSSVAFIYKQFFDGLRMSGGYLPFQAPQLKTIPIPKTICEKKLVLDKLGRLSANLAGYRENGRAIQFLEEVIDACVMEIYLPNHMAERDLLFHSDVAVLFANYDHKASGEKQYEFLCYFYKVANAADHPIHNRLMRIPIDSPDLLGVIQQEMKV